MLRSEQHVLHQLEHRCVQLADGSTEFFMTKQAVRTVETMICWHSSSDISAKPRRIDMLGALIE
jgi:hypothetical protein